MKKILIIIDLQNDFLNGSLGCENAMKVIPNIVDKVKNWDGDIIFTQDTHYNQKYMGRYPYLETQEGKNLPIEHCICGTYGWQINTNVVETFMENKALKNVHFIEKETFGYSDWIYELKDKVDENVEFTLIGVDTSICVVSNALILKAEFPEVKIIVDASCCASHDMDLHNKALDVMQACQIEIVNR